MSNAFRIDPKEMFANETVTFQGIPVCRYHLNPNNEQRIYSTREFVRIYRFMSVLREFQYMLATLQSGGDYHGISYAVKKDLCPTVGREAIAVGESYCMKNQDMLFTDSDHVNALLAKGLFFIHNATDSELAAIVKTYAGGKILAPVSEAAAPNMTVKDLVTEYLLYGTLAELLGKDTGFSHGFAGNRVFMPPIRLYPGDNAGYAVGAALYQKVADKEGIVFAHVKNVAETSSMEAMRISALHPDMPTLFTTVTAMDAYPPAFLACRMGAALAENQMHAECVNGHDPMAVIDAIARKKERMARGDGSAFLEYLVADDLPKSVAEIAAYGGIEKMKNWQENDPCKLYRDKILHHGIAGENELQKMDERTVETVVKIAKLATDDAVSPHPTKSYFVLPDVETLEQKNAPAAIGEFHIEKEEFTDLAGKDAEKEAVSKAFGKNKHLIAIGDFDNGTPKKRTFTFGSSALHVSMATGYAMCGGRVLVKAENDVPLHTLAARAVANTDVLPLPVTVWMDNTVNVHMSALPTVCPTSPTQLKGLLHTAFASEVPTVVLYSDFVGDMTEKESNLAPAHLPFGKANVKKEGTDLTLVSYGHFVPATLQAAETLVAKYHVDAEVIDLGCLAPLDVDAVVSSVEKTGKAVFVGNPNFMQSLAARVTAKAFDYLDGPLVTTEKQRLIQMYNDLEREILTKIHENIMNLEDFPENEEK